MYRRRLRSTVEVDDDQGDDEHIVGLALVSRLCPGDDVEVAQARHGAKVGRIAKVGGFEHGGIPISADELVDKPAGPQVGCFGQICFWAQAC